MRKVSHSVAAKALKVVERFGQQGFTSEQSQGKCIGLALARLVGSPVVVDAAIAGLEDWNGHLSVAAVSAIERGHGTVTREGRTLTIILPEWWGKI